MIGKDVVIAVLLTFCWTAMLFMIVPVSSQGVHSYDPWWDLTGDGKIDIADVARISATYGTLGDPTKNVNVTNFPPAYKVIHYLNKENITATSEYNSYNWSQTAGWIPVAGYSRVTFYLKVENCNYGGFSIGQLVWKSDLNGFEVATTPWSAWILGQYYRPTGSDFAGLWLDGLDSGSAMDETSISGSYVYPVVNFGWTQAGMNATVSIDVYLRNE